jgi:hypothetical protein
MENLPANFNTLPNLTTIELKCETCTQPYSRLVRDVKASIRNNKLKFICKECIRPKIGTHKLCLNCNNTFYTPPYNHAAKFCCSSCSAKYNNVRRSIKTQSLPKAKVDTVQFKLCLHCNAQFTGRPYMLKKQKYCSLNCSSEHRKEQAWQPLKEAIERGETQIRCNIESNNNIFRRFLIEKYGAKCMRCGWDKINTFTGRVPIELEHKDGECTNNTLSNLEILCPNCHSLTATYKGANRPEGGSKRYQMWKEYFK